MLTWKVADKNHLLFPSVLWISRFNALKFFRVILGIFSWKKRNFKEFLEKNPKIILLITWQIVQEGLEKRFENQPFFLNCCYVGHIVLTIFQSSGGQKEKFDPWDIWQFSQQFAKYETKLHYFSPTLCFSKPNRKPLFA